jgi:N-acetylglucosamine malate deacetylase 1
LKFGIPGAFVNTTSVQKTKREALAAHKSQQRWLDTSQGIDCFLLAMENMSLEVGRMSRRFKCAEGWRRHLHLGFSGRKTDPLREALGRNYLVNEAYEQNLEKGL